MAKQDHFEEMPFFMKFKKHSLVNGTLASPDAM